MSASSAARTETAALAAAEAHERAELLYQSGFGERLSGPGPGGEQANRLGDRFRAGIVLYAGEQQLSFGDRLTALPMAALWMLDSSAP